MALAVGIACGWDVQSVVQARHKNLCLLPLVITFDGWSAYPGLPGSSVKRC